MILTQFISGEADLAADRYGAMIQAFRGMYSRALDQSHFGSPKQMTDVSVGAYAIAGVYLNAEWQLITDASTAVALEAQRATLEELSAASSDDLSQAVSEHADQSDVQLSQEISIQIERDISFLRTSLQRTVLSVNMSARAQQLPARTALMQLRISPANELNFLFIDRGATKWPAQRFIRAVWRQHLLAVYNETVLLTLTDHGIDTAEIAHTDPKAPVNGMEISVNAGSALPTYAEIRNEIFHPNSEAILRMISA